MKTKQYLTVLALATIVAGMSVTAIAQEPAESASWGQMKAMYQGDRGRIGGTTLGVAPAVAPPEEPDESNLLTPVDQDILALPQISGTYEQVCQALKRLGFRIESFASDEEAEQVLCSAGEGFALSRLTEEGECPAVHRYRIMDEKGASAEFGFYTVPASILPDLHADGLVTACFEDVRFGGSHINYASNQSYVGWWWNDEFSSLVVGWSSLGGYYRYYADSQYGGSSMVVYSNESVSSLCPTGWNDRISSLKKVQ
jgi:hypothetical protein